LLRTGIFALSFFAWSVITAQAAGSRVALVVGVSKYEHAPALANTINDASAVAAALKRVGFDVETLLDPDRSVLEAGVRRYGERSAGSEASLFYYSGHALEVAGRNWIVPATANLSNERDLRFEAIDLNAVLEQTDGAAVSIVILDACRDNPFVGRLSGKSRSLSRGLVRVETTASGVLIAFSASPGQVAADGAKKHSPFTAALLRHIETVGLEIKSLFARVTRDVVEETKGKQRPWQNSSIEGDFYLLLPPTAAAPAVAPPSATNLEAIFWDSIKASRDPADFRSYMAQFPKGVFIELARNRLAALQQEAASKPQAAKDSSRPGTPMQPSLTAEPTPPQTPASVSPMTRDALFARMTAYSIAPNEREGQARDYDRSAGHKAIAVSIENRRTYRTATWATAAEAEIGALEGCQIEFGKPCALIAVDDEVQRAGPPRVRDMPRLSYNGTFDLAQIPKGRPEVYQRADIINYRSAPEPKAAAFHHRFDTEGALFVVAGGRGQFEVEEEALAQCNNNGVVKDRQGGPCFLYAVGNRVVLPQRATKPLSERRVATSASTLIPTGRPDSSSQSFRDRLLARFATLSVPASDAEKKQARDYEADTGHKAVAVAPAAQSTWRATNRPSDEAAVAAALESCQFVYQEPCILAAVSNRIEPPGGISAPQDMPRTRYTGLFNPEQIPATDVHLRHRPDVASYRSAVGPKAVAFHPWGRLFIAVGGGDQVKAEELALARCNNDGDRKGQGGPCFLYAVGNQVVLPQRSIKPLSQRRSDSPQSQQAIIPSVQTSMTAKSTCIVRFPFGYDEPERQGVDLQKLLELTQWLRDGPVPILSLAISRNGKLVYELYSSKMDGSAAHYLMSITKSVTSALVGAAIDRHLIKATNTTVAENLAEGIFPSKESYKQFHEITLRDILGMSALDAEVPPHQKTPEAIDRNNRFNLSSNHLKFALEQPALAHVGSDFQYTDITPMIAGGIVQYATKRSLMDFARAALFDPMGFQNEEWMHQDGAGFDNASYGLRLRPIDMQKFGMLFLNEGCWEGQQLLSREWVLTSFTPWIKSTSNNREANYGWYWWADRFASGWVGHTANGWKGQRITVVPDKGVVVTMTGIIEDGTEDNVYRDLFNRFIIPAVETRTSASAPAADLKVKLTSALKDIWTNKTAIGANTEARMIPSAAPKEQHREFLPRSP
jgi:uncharacterized caspase-like protein/CubicO group peptidase (beta-lactamase class C family)